ncbi:MAG: sigma-54-dependent Fis family transcriptional regulator [Planctomycetes bacterium]|nr:sigma-54-dependent Fis family transcriptional regulator [Planctomycetota bacterium]
MLVVDDEQAICWAFSQLFKNEGYEVLIAASAEDGLEIAERETPDIALIDVQLSGVSGLDAMPRFREIAPDMPILMITAHGTMETAIEAMRRGAYNYLTKPLHNEDVLQQVRNALKTTSLSREVKDLRAELDQASSLDSLIGKSPCMQEIYKKIGAVAGSDTSVIVTGESGTGKELVARAIHRYSNRAKGPFIAVNCASMPEPLLESELYGHVKGAFTGAHRDRIGKGEAAHDGTLFLDEIGEMPLSIQAKLLRFIEKKRFERVGSTETIEVNVRILTATNRELSKRIQKGLFREDLFFRLNVISIELPPLRRRKEDIPLLIARFLKLAAITGGQRVRHQEISQDAMRHMLRYDWPGNVRELRNTIEHAVLLARGVPIQPEHLPSHLINTSPELADTQESQLQIAIADMTAAALDNLRGGPGNIFREIMSNVENAVVRTAMDRLGGNQVKASRLLGISRNTLRKLISNDQPETGKADR